MAFLDEHGLGIIIGWVKDTFAKKGNLPRVAVSGSYRDLSEKPEAATVLSDGFMTAADKAKLDGIEEGAQRNAEDGDTTYELSQSEDDGHVITLTGSDGSEFTVTVPDNDTTYATVTNASDGLMTPELYLKLYDIEERAQRNAVVSVNSKTGAVVLDKGDVGLEDVDNVPDAEKPVSNPQRAYIAGVVGEMPASESDPDGKMTVAEAIAAKADSATTLAGYGIVDAMTSDQVQAAIGAAASSVYRYRGSKPTVADLPEDGNAVGDVWHVNERNSEHVWDGGGWVELGPIVNLSSYLQLVDVAGIELTPSSNVVGRDALIGRLSNAGMDPADDPVEDAGSDRFVKRSAIRAWGDGIASAVESEVSGLRDALSDHEGDAGNPHGVTAAQLGISVSANLSGGTKLATITVDGNGTDIYAPSGGSAPSTAGKLTVSAHHVGSSRPVDAYEFDGSANVSVDVYDYSDASSSSSGLMSAADKAKLDGVSGGANAVSAAAYLSSGVKVATVTVDGADTDVYAPNGSYSDFTPPTSSAAGAAGLVPAPPAESPATSLKVLNSHGWGRLDDCICEAIGDDDGFLVMDHGAFGLEYGSLVTAQEKALLSNVQRQASFDEVTVTAAGWDPSTRLNGDVEAAYPSAGYHVVLAPCMSTTPAMLDALVAAQVVGDILTNNVKALGDLPSIDITMQAMVFPK